MALTTHLPTDQDGWERADAEVASFSAAFALRRITPAGALVVLAPSADLTDLPFYATFPGYTGDALTHAAFIRAALQAGRGVVCVTPRWGNSTRRMRENSEALYDSLWTGPISAAQLRFLRGVSYGSHLALAWLGRHAEHIEKIAWITPCSAQHLTYAAQQMKMDLRHDDEATTLHPIPKLAVRVLTLPNDQIVPTTDPIFLSLSPMTEKLVFRDGDHFTAGEGREASADIVAWFGGADGGR